MISGQREKRRVRIYTVDSRGLTTGKSPWEVREE
jgi:hypothetical protein